MKIQVMGPGCAKCAEAEKNVRAAVEEKGIDAEVIKVTDFKEIAGFGVFATPAVAIDGKVMVVGKAPSKKEVMGWL
ncbi:thioredoxin family protein [Maridesulfovibrio bastinii]|jgi:small redox-active disulfide protein 2|uniref:thioredoxin family protein n=1 Tax=Maridesulfovibrio bastinii TaxID=47157 RepID=UPI000429636F|nr:thioredoxin family protein [Maridesulfovibrio bastinii]